MDAAYATVPRKTMMQIAETGQIGDKVVICGEVMEVGPSSLKVTTFEDTVCDFTVASSDTVEGITKGSIVEATVTIGKGLDDGIVDGSLESVATLSKTKDGCSLKLMQDATILRHKVTKFPEFKDIF
ncbi:unnamed protein product [Amoebophrya sp. A25]|nr:unnamed protein product [Amoebophrya sp. A25]|eukprot:GSA25T00002838001.1